MDNLKYVKSHFTPRTFVLDARIDATAARPSLVMALVPGFYQVLSGKLTTCISVAMEIERRIEVGDDGVSMPLVGDGTHTKKAA